MSNSHIDRDLDLSNASRGVWLVKIPKYIANRWEKVSSDVEVGKLKISRLVGSVVSIVLLQKELHLFGISGLRVKVPKYLYAYLLLSSA